MARFKLDLPITAKLLIHGKEQLKLQLANPDQGHYSLVFCIL